MLQIFYYECAFNVPKVISVIRFILKDQHRLDNHTVGSRSLKVVSDFWILLCIKGSWWHFSVSMYVLLTYLVHHKRLDLPLKDLHAGCGDHRADIRHHNLTEDVTDEPVVPLEASGCRVFH